IEAAAKAEQHDHDEDAPRHADRGQRGAQLVAADRVEDLAPAIEREHYVAACRCGFETAASAPVWTLPSRRRMVRRVRAATSASCVTTSTVMPVELTSTSRSMICCEVSLSSAPVGSSARINRGLAISERAIATRCF